MKRRYLSCFLLLVAAFSVTGLSKGFAQSGVEGKPFGQITLGNDNGIQFLANDKGIIIEFPADAEIALIDDFKDGWGRVKVNGKYGLVDTNGWILEPQEGVLYLYDGFFIVRKVGSLSILTREGKWLLEPSENTYDWNGNGKVLAVKYKGKFGIVDKTGWIVEPKYDEMQWYSENMIPVREHRLWGFFDGDGHLAIKPQFKYVRRFNEGLAGVNVDGKWGYIDKTGEMVIPPLYDNIDCFFEGLAAVALDDKWGFIDKTGKMVIEPRFDAVGLFSAGLAPFMGDEYLWGYIDTTGKVIIKPQFDEANPFDLETAKAIVRIGDYETGRSGYVDKNGCFTPDE